MAGAARALALLALLQGAPAAVLPPPWADVARNPCAARPGGWLLLYWPQDGQCYTIYKKGHPCPESMELSPGRASGARAECRCPPGAARLPPGAACHALFARGPCAAGEYFAPVEESFNTKGERAGMCVKPARCEDSTQVRWPRDGRCYRRHSQGPCYTATILDLDSDGLAQCTCEKESPQWSTDGDAGSGGCYELYSRGPCENGRILLPGGRCGCEEHLPHHHNQSRACYQIDTTGPCARGHTFSVTAATDSGAPRAACVCKPFHVLWPGDGACYRLYTRGPCAQHEMITRGGHCARIPCARGRLYFPEKKKCYRPGSSEPCPEGHVVTFDFDARPSVDGVSHNGKCSCGMGSCDKRTVQSDEKCSTKLGMAVVNGTCHMVYTQGPCGEGAWLVPGGEGGASCVCRPGREAPDCALASVRIANYLNSNVKTLA